ncbi:MAG: hypothetical protein ABSG01_03570 [Anaerolineales bacterium]|jgi:hypothetical protein
MKKLIKSIIIYIISPLLIFGSIPIYLGVLTGKTGLGIIGAALVFFGIYGYFLLGGYRGVLYILRNPPNIGDTWVEMKVENFIFLKSPPINFDPPRIAEVNNVVELNLTNLASETPENKPPFGLPTKKREEWVRWKKTYSIIKPMITQGKSWNEIVIELELNYPDLPSTTDTLSKIEKAGNDGLLDTWPPNW